MKPLCLVTSVLVGLTALLPVGHTQTLQKIADTNQMTVSYRESAVPFSYLAGGTKAVGFAVDLTEAIIVDVKKTVKRPELQVRYVPVTGQTRIPSLVAGDYDLECGSTTNTAARGKEVAFSINHFYAGTRLLAQTTAGVRNYADLKGKVVVTTAGSTNEKVLRAYSESHNLDMQIVLAKDYAESLQQVIDGKAVAFAMDDILLFGLRANAIDPAALSVVGDTLQVEPYACMVRKDDPGFKQLVDGTIARLMRNGEFERLYSKWFESPIPPKGMNLRMPMGDALKNNLKALSDQPAM